MVGTQILRPGVGQAHDELWEGYQDVAVISARERLESVFNSVPGMILFLDTYMDLGPEASEN